MAHKTSEQGQRLEQHKSVFVKCDVSTQSWHISVTLPPNGSWWEHDSRIYFALIGCSSVIVVLLDPGILQPSSRLPAKLFPMEIIVLIMSWRIG